MENIIQNETAAGDEPAAGIEAVEGMGNACNHVEGTVAPASEPAATPPSDTVVVLMTTRGEKATKTFFRVGDEPPPDKTYRVNDGDGGSIRVGVRSYGNHFLYTSHARPITGIRSLSALLDKLAGVDNAFVVRGEPIPETNPLGSTNPRRSQPRPATSDKPAAPATYRAVARRWIALDMDKVPGKADPATDPEGAARYLIGLLPDEFHGVTCHVQWTSSQGMAPPGTLSARLWYWLEEPAEDRALREWAKAKNAAIVLRLGVAEARALLDPSLFNPVQPHYTAAPVFLDGIPDPLPRRGFLLAGGADAVRIDFGGATLPTKGLAEAIRTFGEDGLWGSLRTLAIAYARETADEAERTPEKLVALLREVMERYDGPRADELPGYIADGPKLTSLAEWALDNVEHIQREVADLNKRHFVSRESGRTRVYNEEWDDNCKRHMLTRSSFEDFGNFHNNRLVRVAKGDEVKWVPLGRHWLSHPQRRQYNRIAFNPAGVEDGAYNLWRGWAVEPEEGDWSLLRTHIRENACGGDEVLFGYLMDWFAHLFQNPAEPGHVAVVFKGNKGTGKGKIAEWVRQACGQHGLQISNSRHLVGNFNAHPGLGLAGQQLRLGLGQVGTKANGQRLAAAVVHRIAARRDLGLAQPAFQLLQPLVDGGHHLIVGIPGHGALLAFSSILPGRRRPGPAQLRLDRAPWSILHAATGWCVEGRVVIVSGQVGTTLARCTAWTALPWTGCAASRARFCWPGTACTTCTTLMVRWCPAADRTPDPRP